MDVLPPQLVKRLLNVSLRQVLYGRRAWWSILLTGAPFGGMMMRSKAGITREEEEEEATELGDKLRWEEDNGWNKAEKWLLFSWERLALGRILSLGSQLVSIVRSTMMGMVCGGAPRTGYSNWMMRNSWKTLRFLLQCSMLAMRGRSSEVVERTSLGQDMALCEGEKQGNALESRSRRVADKWCIVTERLEGLWAVGTSACNRRGDERLRDLVFDDLTCMKPFPSLAAGSTSMASIDPPSDRKRPCSKLNAELLINHPALYFDDGNVILQRCSPLRDTLRDCTLLKVVDDKDAMEASLNTIYDVIAPLCSINYADNALLIALFYDLSRCTPQLGGACGHHLAPLSVPAEHAGPDVAARRGLGAREGAGAGHAHAARSQSDGPMFHMSHGGGQICGATAGDIVGISEPTL
ncbi:hypothetical protein HETIRDRAFT_424506 [Heterobasidion irregulare TC 32-1]|uniref:Uncharacterized protein n=1 Tax=Heterobasidion irregulare (strain TC 32-1) TaxID=747525 RepID=W4KI90_HETIT|nr:uncharacterized protein HETIRDRAFT_424506 [Heterobasidion irregulare TC 32-1]ETW85035.1 hypothetical protein HETIRDRAFT_424506 [Heterobasidion irregulare TC 32-1]